MAIKLKITNGTYTAEGTSATIKCNGKKLASDLVVECVEEVEEEIGNYLKFSSPNSFTLATGNTTKNWDGTLEYSTDTSTWNTWDGTTTLSADNGKLYLRGTGNTVITGSTPSSYKWVLTGADISCEGNIENLLDYATVANGEHPTMAGFCYCNMFRGCTSLTTAPALPATTLATYCYSNMFQGCTGLTQAPELPVTTLAKGCYNYMFKGCTSLTTVPALPATTVVDSCYNYMFGDCTSLTTIPKLPATKMASHCYDYMFYGCTKIKLSETQIDEYQTAYRIPTSGTGTNTTGVNVMAVMFSGTGGTFTGTPSINTTYYTSNTVV